MSRAQVDRVSCRAGHQAGRVVHSTRRSLEAPLEDRGSRKVTLDGKTARPLARYFGGFNIVVFTPEDLALARASPGDRRRFLDRGSTWGRSNVGLPPPSEAPLS